MLHLGQRYRAVVKPDLPDSFNLIKCFQQAFPVLGLLFWGNCGTFEVILRLKCVTQSPFVTIGPLRRHVWSKAGFGKRHYKYTTIVLIYAFNNLK